MDRQTKLSQAVELSTKLATVKRKCGYRKYHAENDAEHSYQLALASWAANSQYKLGLRDERLIKLSLVHDLVEIYSGDFDAHSNKKKQLLKHQKEIESFRQLKNEFYELNEVAEAIEEYEKKESMEAKLINILDKTIPIRHVYKTQ